MRLAYDATALLGPRTGVGVFTAEVLSRLAGQPELDIVAFGVTWRGRDRLGVRAARRRRRCVGRPMAARPLRAEPGPAAIGPRSSGGPVPSTWSTARTSSSRPAGARPRWSPSTTSPASASPSCAPPTPSQYPGLIRRALRRGATIHAVSQFVADEVTAAFAVEPEPGGGHPQRRDRSATASGRREIRRRRPWTGLAAAALRPGPGHRRAPQGPAPLVRAFDLLADARPRAPPGHGRTRRLGGRRPRRRAWPSAPTGRGSCGPGGSTTPAGPPCCRRPPSTPTRRATRASASRRWRPWPRARRWWPPPPAPCPRCWAMPPCWCRRATSTPWPQALGRVLDDEAVAADLVRPGPAPGRALLVGRRRPSGSSPSTGGWPPRTVSA